MIYRRSPSIVRDVLFDETDSFFPVPCFGCFNFMECSRRIVYGFLLGRAIQCTMYDNRTVVLEQANVVSSHSTPHFRQRVVFHVCRHSD